MGSRTNGPSLIVPKTRHDKQISVSRNLILGLQACQTGVGSYILGSNNDRRGAAFGRPSPTETRPGRWRPSGSPQQTWGGLQRVRATWCGAFVDALPQDVMD